MMVSGAISMISDASKPPAWASFAKFGKMRSSSAAARVNGCTNSARPASVLRLISRTAGRRIRLPPCMLSSTT